MRTSLSLLIKRAIDLHVHVGPEVIPRKYTAVTLAAAEQGKLAGAVLKNHFYPTVTTIAQDKQAECRLTPGLVLNNFVGGLNADAVYAMSLVADGPFVVWFPTVHAEQFLRSGEYEIAPEWVADKTLKLRPANQVKPVIVSRNGQLVPQAKNVIKAVSQSNAVLATGHISWQESELVALEAKRQQVRAVIVTHPIYQRIAMPLPAQRRLTRLGCYMEHCFSMYALDGIPITEIVKQIKTLGARYCVLSSDVGQAFSPSPSQALAKFAQLLLAEGISMDELETMLVVNPRRILGIPEQTTYNIQ